MDVLESYIRTVPGTENWTDAEVTEVATAARELTSTEVEAYRRLRLSFIAYFQMFGKKNRNP